jgi:hypothetical protein
MRMSEDPLEMYFAEIANANKAELPSYGDDKTTAGEAKNMAIRDLAAALRAEREQTERDWMRAGIPCSDCPSPERRSYFRMWYENHAKEQEELKRLRERLAELETKCDRCGLRLSHMVTPEQDALYRTARVTTTADAGVYWIDDTPIARMVPE